MSYQLTRHIADQLGEVERMAFSQIRRIIELAGAETAQTLADEAVAIAAQGGILTPAGKPRTLGGIFFHLVRQHLPREIIQQIWLSPSQRKQRQRNHAGGSAHGSPPPPTLNEALKTPPGPTLPGFRWEDKPAIYTALRTKKGQVQMVKITLIGRPGRIVEKQDLVITMMTQMDAPKAFPKGVPVPPATSTDYTIYIGAKQWKTVAAALQNPDDRLIIEGFAAFDPSLEGMAVFVTNTTTKLLQQQKRQASPAASPPLTPEPLAVHDEGQRGP